MKIDDCCVLVPDRLRVLLHSSSLSQIDSPKGPVVYLAMARERGATDPTTFQRTQLIYNIILYFNHFTRLLVMCAILFLLYCS